MSECAEMFLAGTSASESAGMFLAETSASESEGFFLAGTSASEEGGTVDVPVSPFARRRSSKIGEEQSI
mgnify:CR=1 FL=1